MPHYCQMAQVAYRWLPAFIRVRPVGRGPVGVAPREAPDSLCNVFFFLCGHPTRLSNEDKSPFGVNNNELLQLDNGMLHSSVRIIKFRAQSYLEAGGPFGCYSSNSILECSRRHQLVLFPVGPAASGRQRAAPVRRPSHMQRWRAVRFCPRISTARVMGVGVFQSRVAANTCALQSCEDEQKMG